MKQPIVTVFGGAGFIGRHVVRRLAATGAQVRVVTRDAESARFLSTAGVPGQVVSVVASVTDTAAVGKAVEGADWVVNLVGILAPFGGNSFDKIHGEGAGNIAKAAAAAGASRFVHVSAIGADINSAADYARTKGQGEAAVREAFPSAVILRPSVVFGPEDNFFNKFASMSRILRMLPVIGAPSMPKVSFPPLSIDFFGDGGPKFQPVYVCDVADAILAGLQNPAHAGKTFELGGPRVYSFKELMELVLDQVERPRRLLPVPLWLARIQGALVGWLPNPLITRDQVKLLEKDNVVAKDANTLESLGITPTLAEVVLPSYLGRFRDPVRQKRLADNGT
ncbi:MAG: complex I NDUFA9 subunit family protein [Magnetospiraceae bacterium]